MKTGATYTSLRDLPAYDAADEDVRIPANTKLVASSFSTVIDTVTGEVFTLPPLQARNPKWYFQLHEFGEQPLRDDELTLQAFVHEVVRCNEGLMVSDLYDVACDAAPRKVPAINSFSSALSADHWIEMRKDGVKVEKLKHNQRYCTYHVARK